MGEIDTTRGNRGHEEAGDGPAAVGMSLDLGVGILVREGKRIRLRPETLGVLATLIERSGAVVRQEELRSLVWGTRFGNDAGPKQCIRELRRLLDGSSSEPRCIETVGRSGYWLLVGQRSGRTKSSRWPSQITTTTRLTAGSSGEFDPHPARCR